MDDGVVHLLDEEIDFSGVRVVRDIEPTSNVTILFDLLVEGLHFMLNLPQLPHFTNRIQSYHQVESHPSSPTNVLRSWMAPTVNDVVPLHQKLEPPPLRLDFPKTSKEPPHSIPVGFTTSHQRG